MAQIRIKNGAGISNVFKCLVPSYTVSSICHLALFVVQTHGLNNFILPGDREHLGFTLEVGRSEISSWT